MRREVLAQRHETPGVGDHVAQERSLEARRVRQQVAQRHRRTGANEAHAAEPRLDVLVEGDRTLLDELHRRRRDGELRNRRDVEDRRRRVDGPLPVLGAVALQEEDRIPGDHRDG